MCLDKVLRLAGQGSGGYNELLTHFDQNFVMFGALKVIGKDNRQTLEAFRPKYVFFTSAQHSTAQYRHTAGAEADRTVAHSTAAVSLCALRCAASLFHHCSVTSAISPLIHPFIERAEQSSSAGG